MGGIAKWLDLMLLILVLSAGVTMLPTLFVEYSMPIMSYTEDKTAMDVNSGLIVDETVKTGADVFLSLVVADEYCPFPRSIRINDTPVIDITKEWLSNKYTNLQNIYSSSGDYRLSVMLDWTVTSIEYVENGGDPYIQYRLEDR